VISSRTVNATRSRIFTPPLFFLYFSFFNKWVADCFYEFALTHPHRRNGGAVHLRPVHVG